MPNLADSAELRAGVRAILRGGLNVRRVLSYISARLSSFEMNAGTWLPDGKTISGATGSVIDKIEEAMQTVGQASEVLRVHPLDGKHQQSPPAYYELNRIWTELDSLRRRLDAGT